MNTLERFTRTFSQISDTEVHRLRPQRLSIQVQDAGSSREVELVGPRSVIGAHPQTHLRVASESVSALHCELEVTDEGNVLLRDLNSKNGTWITPNVQLRHEALLSPGASFTVGSATLTLLKISDEAVLVSTNGQFGAMLGRGAKMGELFAYLSRVASNDIDVLILGETGTGKEVVARGIHDESARASGPFTTLDCTTIPKELAESTLFGHQRGSFTGAISDAEGVFEQANGGTLFIDEIGELPLDLQAKLLRALQDRSTQRIGDAGHRRPFDARIVAATHRDLRRLVNERRFREDLLFRLGAVEVIVPPLRSRDSSNIGMLSDHFLAECSSLRSDGSKLTLGRDALAALKSHAWPGNVRELQATIMASGAMAEVTSLRASDIRFRGSTSTPPPNITSVPLDEAREDFDRRYIVALLEQTGGNRSEAARRSGKSRNGLLQMLKRLRIE